MPFLILLLSFFRASVDFLASLNDASRSSRLSCEEGRNWHQYTRGGDLTGYTNAEGWPVAEENQKGTVVYLQFWVTSSFSQRTTDWTQQIRIQRNRSNNEDPPAFSIARFKQPHLEVHLPAPRAESGLNSKGGVPHYYQSELRRRERRRERAIQPGSY